MTKTGHEGRIFLSHPPSNNGFYVLLTIKYRILDIWKTWKCFQNVLNTLRFDIHADHGIVFEFKG